MLTSRPFRISAICLLGACLLLFSWLMNTPASALAAGPFPQRASSSSTPAYDASCQVEATACAPSAGTPAPGENDPANETLGEGRPVMIYFFWRVGCPHCAQAKPFLKGLAVQHPEVGMKSHEIGASEQNREFFKQLAASYGFEARVVPTIFIGQRYWQGYNETIAQEIEAAITTCIQFGCPDPALQSMVGGGLLPLQPQAPGAEVSPAAEMLDVPFLGQVNLSGQSLWLSTLLISFVDGVNPCSIWVLTMLLAITLHSGSRRKVLIIGIIYLTVTAFIYALFIAGLFTVFTFISFLGWIQAIVALVALFFGLVNVKDYFWYKEGFSLTIADDKKPGIYQNIRRLMNASESFGGLVMGTVIMAGGVSLVEFSCTAGFPVLWTNLLVSQKVDPGMFLALLLLYMVIYQLDEMAIFFTAVYTLKASRLEEKQGRILKLAGGMLMLCLAVVMLINPALMNNLGSALLIFGSAMGITGLVLILHRRVLPRLGIFIGSEFTGQ